MKVEFYEHWYDVLNNFSARAVEIDGLVYPTSEHAYQAAKCTNEAGRDEIRHARSPLLAKTLSNEKYALEKRKDWEGVKLEVMESILREKMQQHEEVRNALIRSGDQVIAEASPQDSFWGTGMGGDGQNQLGKIWMKLRAEITTN